MKSKDMAQSGKKKKKPSKNDKVTCKESPGM
jgi:hypothetical protein